MELHELEKERDAYSGKIAQLAIHIAVIFALPALIAIGLSHWFSFSLMFSLAPAFVISWTLIVMLYRRVDKKVRQLEENISRLRSEE